MNTTEANAKAAYLAMEYAYLTAQRRRAPAEAALAAAREHTRRAEAVAERALANLAASSETRTRAYDALAAVT